MASPLVSAHHALNQVSGDMARTGLTSDVPKDKVRLWAMMLYAISEDLFKEAEAEPPKRRK